MAVRMRRTATTACFFLLTVASVRSHDGDGVGHCGPQNLTLSSSGQTLLSTWQDDRSCSALHRELVYELTVLAADAVVHHDKVVVAPDQIGSTHSWYWTSRSLALECVSHTVRVSSRYGDQTRPRRREQTLPVKTSTKPEVYLRGPWGSMPVFEVGSRETFCCVLPAGHTFDRMSMSGYDSSLMDPSRISNQTYSMTVDLVLPTNNSSTDVTCTTTDPVGKEAKNGASFLIGYPPRDKDLQCETRDLESVECHWTVGGNGHLLRKWTTYQLLGRPCAGVREGWCSQTEPVDGGEREWTLTAQNPLGEAVLSVRTDLMTRVHMFAPERVTASSVHSRNVTLTWSWTPPRYSDLGMTCQVNVTGRPLSEDDGVGLRSAVVTDLRPNWTYGVAVRCATTQHRWKWSDWSRAINFRTKGDVPDALDVWMQVKESQTRIIWKVPEENQSHGRIVNYTVTWTKTTDTQRNTTTVGPDQHQVVLHEDTNQHYLVTATARNEHGSSAPSAITTPRFSAGETRVIASWITGVNGSFSLGWTAAPAVRCGYVVDWFPTVDPSAVEWLRVLPNQTRLTIGPNKLKPGLRYSLSVSACTQGAPVLLERREGYASEQRIQDGLFKNLDWKQEGSSSVEVSWAPVSLTEQSAFIQGYALYWSGQDGRDFNVSTGRPEATSLTATQLKTDSYTFTVKAQTAVGECGDTRITVTLNSPTDNLIKAVVIALVTAFALLALFTIMCYTQWACIKQKVFPPIPRPVLTDRWLTPADVGSCRSLHMDECHHSEGDILVIPQLHDTSGKPPITGFMNGYYNQHPGQRRPSPPPQLRGLMPNPTYNLMMEDEEQKAQLQAPDGTSTGYEPQSCTDTLTTTQPDTDAHMTCDLTYVLLPQQPSTQ